MDKILARDGMELEDAFFAKEDAKLISDTILAAVQDAAKQAKEYNEAEMQKITGSFQMPGLF